MPRRRRLIGWLLALGLAAAALAVVPRAGADQAGPFTAGAADAYVASNTPATKLDTRELRARNGGSWALYPGDDVVDWMAWNTYNWANCARRTNDTWQSFQQTQQAMYAHLDAVGNAKPRMIGEYGSHDDPAMGSKEQWFRDVPAVLRLAMPKVKAVVYFDRVGAPVPGDPCNWIVDSSPQA